MKRELWRLIYMSDDRVHLRAARIIGYARCPPLAFWDEAKKLPDFDQRKYQRAMEDLTAFSRREGSDPRYEFNSEARTAVRVLLGPPPEDPEYAAYWSKEVFQPGMKEPHLPEAQADEKPKKRTGKKAPPKEKAAKKPVRKKKAG